MAMKNLQKGLLAVKKPMFEVDMTQGNGLKNEKND
jgi:hypothetical protein